MVQVTLCRSFKLIAGRLLAAALCFICLLSVPPGVSASPPDTQGALTEARVGHFVPATALKEPRTVHFETPAAATDPQAAIADPKALLERADSAARAADYELAESLYLSVLGSTAVSPAADYTVWAGAKSGMGELLIELSRFGEAVTAFSDVVSASETHGIAGAEYFNALNRLGNIMVHLYDFEEFAALAAKAVAVQEEAGITATAEFAESLGNMGLLYTFMGERSQARECMSRYEELMEEVVGRDSFRFSRCLTALGMFHYYMNDLAASEKTYRELAALTARTRGKDHPSYAVALLSISTPMMAQGRLDGVKEMLIEGLEIIESRVGKYNSSYSGGLSNLASLYQYTGDFSRGEQAYIESMDVTSRLMGKEHAYYYNALNGLAIMYNNYGLYRKAEPLMLESLELRRKTVPPNDPGIINALISLATLYATLDNYEDTGRYTDMAFGLIEPGNEAHKPLLVNLWNLQAERLREQGDNDGALEAYRKAMSILSETAGSDRITYLKLEGNLLDMMAYTDENGDPEIEARLVERMESRREGGHQLDQVTDITRLTIWYYHTGQSAKAARHYDLYNEKIRSFSAGWPENGMKFFYHSAMTFQQSGDIKRMKESISECLSIIRHSISDSFIFLPDNERELFWQTRSTFLSNLVACCADKAGEDPSLAGLLLDAEMLRKSMLLYSSSLITRDVLDRGDAEELLLWNNLRQLKASALAMENDPAGAGADRDMIIEQVKRIEKELLGGPAGAGSFASAVALTWRDLLGSLGNGTAAVEYVRVNFEEPVYAALVVKPGAECPIYVELCYEKDLTRTGVNNIRSLPGLYDRIWKPLEAHLEGVTTVYIVPDGLLNTVSFAGLRDRSGFLCERYTLRHILSSRDIAMDTRREVFGERSAFLLGGADYSATALDIEHYGLTRDAGRREQGFPYLPGSLDEIRGIESRLTAGGWKVSTLSDAGATEQGVRDILSVKAPDIIHFATHGYSKPQAGKNNPLDMCGLALAGANMTGDAASRGTPSDNVLTGSEISLMDLRDTDLVVLSACDSGLGEIINGEGVYGLQRAFRLAGAGSIIVSLWKVPDMETAEFMTGFYSNLTEGDDISTAFDKATAGMMARYRNDVQKWAGFRLILSP